MARTPRNPRKVSYKVTLTLPTGARPADGRAYVEDAVACWHGSLRPPGGYEPNDPGDPMFTLDGATVKVHRLYPQKRKPCA